MPIDFYDFLRSRRADGKLILSNAIKAFAGSKILIDARDSTNALEIDLEDSTGDVATISIPKGAAVDAVARQEAEDAQAAIDAHEADHPEGGGGDGTDQVARDAADAAQAEIDAHEASTHNTDPVARNRGTTARNEAQAAQDDIDEHEVDHPTQRVLNQDPNADADTLGKFQIDPRATPTPPRRIQSMGQPNLLTLPASPTPTISGN